MPVLRVLATVFEVGNGPEGQSTPNANVLVLASSMASSRKPWSFLLVGVAIVAPSRTVVASFSRTFSRLRAVMIAMSCSQHCVSSLASREQPKSQGSSSVLYSQWQLVLEVRQDHEPEQLVRRALFAVFSGHRLNAFTEAVKQKKNVL